MVNTVQDTLSISMINLVAVQWLRKINPSLVDIIKVEYSTDLRDNVQLAHLVPRIAPNIDSLLTRYDKTNSINKVRTTEDTGNTDLAQDTNLSVNRV